MNQWGYPGYGFPSWGGYPLGNPIVLGAGVDSTISDTVNVQNQDSSFVSSIDSSTNFISLYNSNYKSNSIKQFFQNKRKERIERKRKRQEKRMLRKSI